MTASLRPALEAIRDVLCHGGGQTIADRLRDLLDADQRWALALTAVLSLEGDDRMWLADQLTIAAATVRQKRAIDDAQDRAIADATRHEIAAHVQKMARAVARARRELAAKTASDEEAA